jgi:hypothetical protein
MLIFRLQQLVKYFQNEKNSLDYFLIFFLIEGATSEIENLNQPNTNTLEQPTAPTYDIPPPSYTEVVNSSTSRLQNVR